MIPACVMLKPARAGLSEPVGVRDKGFLGTRVERGVGPRGGAEMADEAVEEELVVTGAAVVDTEEDERDDEEVADVAVELEEEEDERSAEVLRVG